MHIAERMFDVLIQMILRFEQVRHMDEQSRPYFRL